MFLVRDSFRDARADSIGALWDRVLAARAANPDVFGDAALFVLDQPRGKVSVCDAIVRALPELEPFYTTVRGAPALSSATGSQGVDLVQACTQIAGGIPRRFAARWCVLALTFAGPGIPEELRGTPSPGQDMHPAFDGLKVSRRIDESWLCASYALGAAECDLDRRPDPRLTRAAAQLGAETWSETRVVLSDAEVRAQRRVRKELEAVLRSAPRVSALAPSSLADASGEPRWRAAFDEFAGRLGYARSGDRSEPRAHVALRELPSGNLLELRADLGGVGKPRLVAVDLSLLCLGWQPFVFAVAPQTPIATQAAWVDLLERVASVVQAIEAAFVALVEARVGGSPPGLRALGRFTVAPRAG